MLGWDVRCGGVREAVHQRSCREGVHLLVLVGVGFVFSGILKEDNSENPAIATKALRIFCRSRAGFACG